MRTFETILCWVVVGMALSNIINTIWIGYYTTFAFSNMCLIGIFGLFGWLLLEETKPEKKKKSSR
jgi:hypothetical protein